MEGLPPSLMLIAQTVARGLEIAGVGVILIGVLTATFVFARSAVRARNGRRAYERYRADLGRGILLGLEFLVGADIISTVTAPLTFESVGILAAVVAIRTVLSFALETEITGCWPWDRARQRGPMARLKGPGGEGQTDPGNRLGAQSPGRGAASPSIRR